MAHEPARVMPLDRTDYNRCRSYAPELLTDPDVQVVAVPPRPGEDLDPLHQRLAGRLRPGVLLVRNIWRAGEYLEATTAYEELSLQKFLLFAGVCQRLGATRLEVTEIQEIAEDGRQSARAKLSLLTGKGSASFRNETTVKVARRLKACWSWPGSRPDVDAATALATGSGLAADDIVMGLIDQRGYDANLLTQHDLELDTSSEARREVAAAAEVQSLAKKLGPAFDADLTVLRSQTSSIRLSLTMTFA
ncbi:hypothetical protein [Actinoplanes aureus]|uniref:Uncharacterized protein n=1 Tax=Actinoplanes aureus TaxID=2792083 RepID=A0A931CE29_9ACTN|nr:hypothetical protein [Actinoplanes aureus]MBG0565493.1 hypothetical protein [Actinoplanes aureus]